MPPWVRYGLIGGVIAGASTLAGNLAITLQSTADLCRQGPLIIPLLSLGAVIILIGMAAAAGFATTRHLGSVAEATLSGVVVGVIAGCALLALIPFASTATHRLEELTAQCPQGAAFNFGGSFSFGTPPPGVVIPTPPPGFFTTSPPPGAFSPPAGFAGAVLAAIGALVTIGFGVGLAAGAAALAGLAGASGSRSPSG
jgi:hypothetical protein